MRQRCDVFLVTSPAGGGRGAGQNTTGGGDGRVPDRASAIMTWVKGALGKEWMNRLIITDNVGQLFADVVVDSALDPLLTGGVGSSSDTIAGAAAIRAAPLEPFWEYLLFRQPWNPETKNSPPPPATGGHLAPPW